MTREELRKLAEEIVESRWPGENLAKAFLEADDERERLRDDGAKQFALIACETHDKGKLGVAAVVCGKCLDALRAELEALRAPIPEDAVYRSMSEGKRLVVAMKAKIEKQEKQIADYETVLTWGATRFEAETNPIVAAQAGGEMYWQSLARLAAEAFRKILSRYSRSEGVKDA